MIGPIVILLILLSSSLVNGDVGFSIDMSKQEIVFGETLFVNFTITPNEHIQDQSLEVRLPPNLLFTASVRSTTCDATGRNCTTDSKVIKDSELSNTGRFDFDTRTIEESKRLVVFQNTSNWNPGYTHQTEIQLINIAATDLTGHEFIVGVLRYWWDKNRVNNEENIVQNFVGRNFTLYPAKIYILVDNVVPNSTADFNRIYSGVEKSITLVAETDPRAGVMILKVELPTIITQCDGPIAVCNGSKTNTVPLLNVVKSTYVLGQGKGANKEQPVPWNQSSLVNTTKVDGSALVLSPDMLTDGSGGTCSGSCKVNLTTVVITDDRFGKPGQQINISASVYYGYNFGLSMGTPPIFMTVVGPELEMQLVASPNSDLEAGMEVDFHASLKHSSTSSEDLILKKVALTIPDEDALKLVPGSATLTKNGGAADKFPDANITQGVLIGDFPLKSTADIKFKVALTDSIPLHSKLRVQLGMDFGFRRASDACLPDPCLHGGTCVPPTNGQPAKCQCTSDYEGVDCSKRVCKRGNWKTATDTSDICYYFPNKVLSFMSAYQECAQLGANLPSIHSAASDIWALASYWISSLRNVSDVWIGLYRESPTSNWKWIDDSPLNLLDWYDDIQPKRPGDCAVSSSLVYHNYRWLNRDCSLAYYFFCADPPKAASGGSRTNSRNVYADLNTKLLNIKTELTLGDRIRIHQPVNISVSFAMPLGTLRDAQLETVFTSNDTYPIPIVFTSSDLSVPPSVNCSRQDIFRAKMSDFLINPKTALGGTARVKRAVPSNLLVVRPLGTLVNSARSGQSGAPISLTATFLTPGSSSSNFSGSKFSMTSSLGINGMPIPLVSKQAMFAQAELVFNKTYQSSPASAGEVLVTATISHAQSSTGPAYDLNYLDDLECLRIRQVPKDVSYLASCKEIRAKRAALDVGDSMVMTYAVSADKGMDYEPSFRNATINFTSIQPGEFIYQEYPGQKGAMEVSTCIIRKDDVMIFDRNHIHLYSGLAFLLAIILAALAVLLALYLYWRSKRRRQMMASDEEQLLDGEDGESTKSGTATAALKQKSSQSESHAPAVDVGSMIADGQADETILAALTEPRHQQMYRHLDRMDVAVNVAIEDQLNASKLQNFVDAAVSVTSVIIPDERLTNEVAQKLRKRVGCDSRKLDEEQKGRLDKLRRTLRIKNGDRMRELKSRQAVENNDFAAKTETIPDAEGEGAMNAMKAQQQAQLDDILHKLQVEQELEFQRVAEELQAKKEGLLFDIEAQLVKDLASEGKLDAETADSLSQVLDKANAEVLHWFDSELARQRALMDEKCQFRRHLAMQKELWDQQHDELIEILIKQYFDAIDHLIKKGLINDGEAHDLRQDVKKQVHQLRDWLDKERRSRESKLRKAAAAERKKRINELKTQQQKELDILAKTLKEKKATMTDPLQYVRGLQRMAAEQREHVRVLENKLDEDATDELNKMCQGLENEFRLALEDKKKGLLKSKNFSEQDLQNLIAEHKDHVNILAEKHEFQRHKQMGKLEEILQQLKHQAAEKAEKEMFEQAELRQHEKSIAKMLIDQQASLSDTDRETLVRLQLEHLANMKNGLAVNRLHQIQLLEKKLAKRKTSLVERLERKRHTSSKPVRRSDRRPKTASSEQAGSSSISSEDERNNQSGTQQMSLMDYAQQRLHIARDTTLDVGREVETLQQTLFPQRAQLLKEREENLGALVAQLQIEKAKQLVEMEQQEDALANLTTCMVEDLNDRGVLSNPDCHRILEKHQIEQQRLSERLQEQKEKQDLILKQQLVERTTKKHTVLEKKQQRLSQSRPITAVEHIDNINLIHNYALEREKLMQQSEREMEQALQDQRREFELKKHQALQDQEIDLINNLVQMGEFKRAEVSGVLRMLFPDKTKEEVRALAKKVYKKAPTMDDASKERKPPVSTTSAQTSLAKRLEMTSGISDLIEDRVSPDSGSSSGIDVKRKRNNGMRVQHQRPRSRPRTHLPPISKRPEPVGASVDQVAEYLPDRRIARVAPTQVTATRQTYHQ